MAIQRRRAASSAIGGVPSTMPSSMSSLWANSWSTTSRPRRGLARLAAGRVQLTITGPSPRWASPSTGAAIRHDATDPALQCGCGGRGASPRRRTMIVPTRSYGSPSSPSTSSPAWAAIRVRTSSVSVEAPALPPIASSDEQAIGEPAEPGPLAGVEQGPLGGPGGRIPRHVVGQAVAAGGGTANIDSDSSQWRGASATASASSRIARPSPISSSLVEQRRHDVQAVEVDERPEPALLAGGGELGHRLGVGAGGVVGHQRLAGRPVADQLDRPEDAEPAYLADARGAAPRCRSGPGRPRRRRGGGRAR